MANNLDKIIENSIYYLKFINDNSKYDIYSDCIKVQDMKISELSSSVNYPPEKIEKENILIKEKQTIQRNVNLSLITEDWMESGNIGELDKAICNCKKCILGTKRINFVFGVGNPNADAVLVGEAPGAEEDKQGIPFVGRAGKLLTDILKAISLSRDEVYICNIIKCRPPENRNPLPEEIGKCEPYLLKQLELIKPKFILSLGTFASQTLLRTKEPLGRMRGKIYDYVVGDQKIKLMVTYHPAALLRNPNWKKPTWEDVQLFRKEYNKVVNK
jgi:DNA polymerase